MVSALWNLEPITNEKQINGTYWMHYKADMFAIESDLKETSRLRRGLSNATIDGVFDLLYSFLILHGPMMTLEIVAFFSISC